MKIVYFFDAIARMGGVERILTEKINYLVENYDQEIYLITTSQGNHPFTFPLSPKIKHIDLSVNFHSAYKYSLLKRIYMEQKMKKEFILNLTNVVNEICPDIIISISYFAADIICNIKCSAQKIIESHVAKSFTGVDGSPKNIILSIYNRRKWKRYFRIIEKKSDMIVSLTKGDAREWNSKNVVVIPNIISPHKQKCSQLKNKIALFAGRFSYQKGLDRMLKAWKIVISRKNDWVLRLVGDGELKRNLIDQCKALGIEKNVIFAEFTKDMAKEYSNSSLFLMTSRYEGLPMVLIEANSYGLPCISFDCPYGPEDVIDNGKNGIIVENGNIEEFANAVLKLIDDEELRKNMGRGAREKAKKYLPETIMPQWMKLFSEITEKN